ncbi:hypothetical protein PISMIDRAFT_672055 [Pisolithus microcarpus 441]|uniref:Uncharacterized protein n=1 Tax=Pisolithus microcarpus 441 TaxID=765257 RepID=A0A0C9ZJ73_9AGAM|nr:hypothetical protein PISMIDRAFT_672055 [Pisolithus microcarpus 441]
MDDKRRHGKCVGQQGGTSTTGRGTPLVKLRAHCDAAGDAYKPLGLPWESGRFPVSLMC